jgi:tetratricopeptide (TPR) repeat protein
MHRWGESIALWNRIGEIGETGMASDEEALELRAVVSAGLGDTWLDSGNLARAEPLLRRSLELLRQNPAAHQSQLAVALAAMARLYVAQGKLALAGDAVGEAIERDEKALGAAHPQVAALLEARADIRSRRGETQDARDDLERARAIMAGHLGANSTAVAAVLAALGDVEARAKQPAVAVARYAEAVEMLRNGGGDTLQVASAIVPRYAAALRAAHRSEEAKVLLRSFPASWRPASAATGAQGFREK